MEDGEAANVLGKMKNMPPDDLFSDPDIKDAVDAANTLVQLKQSDIRDLEFAITVILDLNDMPNRPDLLPNLKTRLQTMEFEEIERNSKELIEYGILPEIVSAQDMVKGGVATKSRSSLRSKAQTKNRVSMAMAKLPSEKQVKLEEEAHVSEFLKTSRTLNRVNNVSYEQLDPELKALNICSNESGRASKFMDALFPTPLVTFWQKNIKKNCRNIYELSAVPTQCINTIGQAQGARTIPPPDNNNLCYICGFPFKDIIGLRPTCEHILPIIQAIFFLDLYRPSMKGQLTLPQHLILNLEYDWAHECCNYVKSDVSFLQTVYDKPNPNPISWALNINNLGGLLHAIQEAKPSIGPPLWGGDPSPRIGQKNIQEEIKKWMSTNPGEDWLKTRGDIIYETKMKPIIDYIATKGNYGIVTLMGFGNCLDQTKMSAQFKQLLKDYEEGKKFPAPPPRNQNTLRNRLKADKNKTLKQKKIMRFPGVSRENYRKIFGVDPPEKKPIMLRLKTAKANNSPPPVVTPPARPPNQPPIMLRLQNSPVAPAPPSPFQFPQSNAAAPAPAPVVAQEPAAAMEAEENNLPVSENSMDAGFIPVKRNSFK